MRQVGGRSAFCSEAQGQLLEGCSASTPRRQTTAPCGLPCLPCLVVATQAIVQQMSGELERFQRERAQEMGYVLRDFALAQARVSGDTARLWASLVPGLAAAAGGGSVGGS